MISQRKIEANRRNAAKSTGPRTAEGKAKVRFNAVTHGLSAATVVLPHEDEQACQHRLDAWTRELKASGELGQYLVERVVPISWQLDRADTFEQARLLAKRIQEAPRLFGASHAEPVETLFARLLGMAAEPRAAWRRQPGFRFYPIETGPFGLASRDGSRAGDVVFQQ